MFQANLALNGYLCSDVDMACYSSNAVDQLQFWVADMSTPKNISRIVYQSAFFDRVNGVKIRAGLDPNIYNDPVLVTVTYVADYYLQTYEFVTPILARYIGITGPYYIQLELCNMMAFT